MHIVVCVCTRDRIESLRRTLRSLAAVDSEGIRWDVLVIDNGSRNNPARLIQEFRGGLNVRLVVEPQPGVSHARNLALAEADGTHLIFIDDDVTISPDWLCAYVDGFERHPDAAFFGGPIAASASGVSPEWFSTVKTVVPGAIGALEPDCGEHAVTLASKLLPWGANMAFRRPAIDGYKFDPQLGRRPDNKTALGEETTFIRTLLRDGRCGVWLPRARLLHHVGANRFSIRYIGRFSRALGWYQGYTEASLESRNFAPTLDWARREVRKRRWHRLTVPPWAALRERSEAVCKLEWMRGFHCGLQEALKATQPHERGAR